VKHGTWHIIYGERYTEAAHYQATSASPLMPLML